MKLGEMWNDQNETTVVTDAWLRFVASGKFPLLTSLNLANCNNITETDITELVRGCPKQTKKCRKSP